MKLVAFEPAQHHTAWDEFADTQGRFFHRSDWYHIISRTYRFTPQYYFWEQDGAVVGLLPAFAVRRPFAGRALISNPFAVSAGPLLTSGADTSRAVADIEAIAETARIDYIELRDVGESAHWPSAWTFNQGYSSFEKELTEDHEANLLAIPNRQRAVIRKADQRKLQLVHHENMSRFLSVYSESLRNLGTPIYPRRYFSALQAYLAPYVNLFSVQLGNKDITTLMSFHYQNRVMPYYGGGTPLARDCHGFPWMYWQLMKLGVDRGELLFDFGRSPAGSGAYQFKKNLGFSPRPLNYAYKEVRGRIPDLSLQSGMVQRLTGIWQHLPVPLTRIVGPVGAVYAV